MGDNKSAVEVLQKAADLNLDFLGEDTNTAQSYHDLGVAQNEIRDRKRALDSLQKATHMRSNLLGDQEDTARSYHVLGVV